MKSAIDLEQEYRRISETGFQAAQKGGIRLATHLDNRLPARIEGDRDLFQRLLVHLMHWSSDGSPGTTSTLSIWLEQGRGGQSLLIEAGRSGPVPSEPPEALAKTAERLGAAVELSPARMGRVNQLTVRLALPRAATSRRIGDIWAGRFEGKQMLLVEHEVFDPARCAASLASIGLTATFEPDPDEALGLVGGNTSYDFILLYPHLLQEQLDSVAQKFLDAAPQAAIVIQRETVPDDTNDRSVAPRWSRPLDLLFSMILRQGTEPASQQSDSSAPDLAGHVILIAEDTATSQSLLHALLAPTGARLLIAENGLEAVRLYRSEPVDLVLMDIQMPGMDGLTATRQIRQLKADAVIIAVTAYAQAQDQRLYQRLGLQGFLAKPIQPWPLYDAITRHLPLNRNTLPGEPTDS